MTSKDRTGREVISAQFKNPLEIILVALSTFPVLTSQSQAFWTLVQDVFVHKENQ